MILVIVVLFLPKGLTGLKEEVKKWWGGRAVK